MDVVEAAALITAMAALISAIVWPVAIALVVLVYRKPFSAAFGRLPSLVDRMQKIKLGALEAELDRQAEAAGADPQAGEVISTAEIRAAAKIETEARLFDNQSLRDKVQQLCFEYETIRKVLPSGRNRTSAMTQVFIKMRTLGPAVSDWIEDMKTSTVSGNRLWAIAIMQIDPDKADLNWLVERFRDETPFLFFHAANALRIPLAVRAVKWRKKHVQQLNVL